jgi:frataxin
MEGWDMSLDDSQFAKLAKDTIEGIADAVDDALGDELDVDVQNGILTITLPNRSQYVINAHEPNRQIWLSSPASGASHYERKADAWISTRDSSVQLLALLRAELKAATGVEVGI